MACSLGQNPLTGERYVDGEMSGVYRQLVEAIPENYKPDLYVLAAYKEGYIKNFSREEVAVALLSKLYTRPVQEKLKGWDRSKFDEHGAPLFSFVLSEGLIGLDRTHDDYYLSGMKGSLAFVRGLVEKGLVYKWGNEYRLTDGSVLAGDERTGEQQRMLQIKQMLAWLGVPEGFAVFEEKDNGIIGVKFNADFFNVTKGIGARPEQMNTRKLVGYLAERFPGLNVQFVSEEEGRKIWEKLEERKERARGKGEKGTKVEGEQVGGQEDAFDRVNSFANNGVIYLIEGRVTDLVAVEEVLHPFVYAMAESNRGLFDDLVAAAKVDFKDLWQSIRRQYADAAGFDEADRERELVTQALGRVLRQQQKRTGGIGADEILEMGMLGPKLASGGGAGLGVGVEEVRGATATIEEDSETASEATSTGQGGVRASEGKRMKRLLGRVIEWLARMVKEVGRVLGDKGGKVLAAKGGKLGRLVKGLGLMGTESEAREAGDKVAAGSTEGARSQGTRDDKSSKGEESTSGEKGKGIDIGKLARGLSLSDVARLLNVYDAQFFVDGRNMGMAFSQSGAVGQFQDELIDRANKLQKKILVDLFSLGDRTSFDSNQKGYLSGSGKLLDPLSTSISGSEQNMLGKAGLRQLFGNHARVVMESLAAGESFAGVEQLYQDGDAREFARQAYKKLQRQLREETEAGDIVVPYLLVPDHANDVADLMDFVIVKNDGSIVVLNINVSEHRADDEGYLGNFQKAAGVRSRLPGDRLSERQRNHLKAAGRRRLLENNGYKVDRVASVLVHVPTDAQKAAMGDQAYDVRVNESRTHGLFDNEQQINKVFRKRARTTVDKLEQFRQQVGQGNPTRRPGFVSGSARMPSSPIQNPASQATVRTVKKGPLTADQKALAKKVEELIKSVQERPKSQMVLQLGKVLELLQYNLSQGQVQVAFAQFVGAAQEKVEEIQAYLSDESKIADPEYVRVAVEAEWYLKSFADIGNVLDLHSGLQHQSKRLRTLQKMLAGLQSRIDMSLLKHVRHMVETLTEEDLTEKDFKEILEETEDLSSTDYWVRDLSTSKDRLIALADKLYKRQRYAQVDRMREFQKLLDKHRADLEVACGKDVRGCLERLWEKTAEGKKTGRILQRFGPKYQEILEKLESKVRTVEGLMKQYREVDSVVDARPEDLAYNKQLYADNLEVKKFREAETQTETGVADGMFHRYVAEFIREREQYEMYEPVYDENGKFIRGQWVQKRDANGKKLVSDAAYRQYKAKYYEEVIYDKAVFDDNGDFTGVFVKKGGKMSVVKSEYVEIREVAGDGTSMLNAEYEALKNDMTPTGQAVWAFYKFFVEQMEATNDLLPDNVRTKMLGRMALVRGNVIDEIKRSPNWFIAGVKAIGKWFSLRTYAKEPLYNDDKTIASQIPIFFTGNLRNELLVEELRKELSQMDADYKDGKIASEDYWDARKKLQDELHMADKAPTAEQLETDLFLMLFQYRDMAETYAHLNIIEGTVHAVLHRLKKRAYKLVNFMGNVKKRRGNDTEVELAAGKGEHSFAYKRYKKWMEMVFYNSQELDAGTWEVVGKKLMRASSFINVGLNTFGAIHNFAMAAINTAIEAAGEMYFSRKASLKAGDLLVRELLPGHVASQSILNGVHKAHQHGSKMEAIVDYFQMIQEGMGKDHKIAVGAFLAPGYKGMEIGEYSMQATSGTAYLLSHDLQNKRTEETMSIYDAFDWDRENGLRLKAGFKITAEMKHNITYAIREMNKKIHGNYAWEDRMVIQNNLVGQLAAQYHKWFIPALDQRFGRQGRYKAIYNLFRNMYRAQGSILERMRAGWKGLKDWEVRGMYKNAAELVFFMLAFGAYGLFRSLARDTDKDDKNTKRWWNFLGTESDRIEKEILFFVPVFGFDEQLRLFKNPFAVFPTLDMFAGVVKETWKVAMPPYDDEVYYDRGPFKGELKLKKEVFDLTPIMKDINKWRSYSQVTNFYIK